MLIVANSNSCRFNFHDTNIHNLRRERVINYWIPRWLAEYFYWLLCRWWNRNLHQAGLMMLMIEITCFNMIDMIIINWDIIRNKRNSKAFIISAYTIMWKFFLNQNSTIQCRMELESVILSTRNLATILIWIQLMVVRNQPVHTILTNCHKLQEVMVKLF